MVSATVQWLQCIMHGLNLALEKSCCFDRIGSSIRSVSTFCRGQKHTWLVNYMKYIQQPEQMPASVAASLAKKIRAAHANLTASSAFEACTPTEPDAIGGQLKLVGDAVLERKMKKGTDVRWEHECRVLDDKLLHVAHLLAPAILMYYGTGNSFEALAINEATHASAHKVYSILTDDEFVFYATLLRLQYTLVYKAAFKSVQHNHHRCAPVLAGPNGLPQLWMRAFEAAVASQPSMQRGGLTVFTLAPAMCQPLITLLERRPALGGLSGEHALRAVQDLRQAAVHCRNYFGAWAELQMLPHVLCLERVGRFGPMPELEMSEAVRAAEAGELSCWSESGFFITFPHEEALAAAQSGLQLFDALMPDQRDALQGELPWKLFSPVTRDGQPNPTHAETVAFAGGGAGLLNPLTHRATPYRAFPRLTAALIRGGAKDRPSNSGILESLFNALPRIAGASKHNISPPGFSAEARTAKNGTAAMTSPAVLQRYWPAAKKLQAGVARAGFWLSDVVAAANRREVQVQAETAKEMRCRVAPATAAPTAARPATAAPTAARPATVASPSGGPPSRGPRKSSVQRLGRLEEKLKRPPADSSEEEEEDSSEEESSSEEERGEGEGESEDELEPEDELFEVEKLEGHRRKGKKVEYLVKWKGYDARAYDSTEYGRSYEPEENLLLNPLLPQYWKGKKGPAAMRDHNRVLRLHQQALLDAE